MGKCKQCNVYIRDESQVCPLCRCVVEQAGGENTYPDVYMAVRRLKKLSNVCLFFVILFSACLITINCSFYDGLLWSLIPVAGMAYGYLVLRYAILSKHGYRAKIMVLALFGVGLVILIDWVTGFHRWSVNCVFPGGLMLVDGIIVALMLLNKRSWQSYIVFQIGMIFISLLPLLLWYLEVITWPLLSFIALAAAVFLFLGSVIIGDRSAREELRRRFHI